MRQPHCSPFSILSWIGLVALAVVFAPGFGAGQTETKSVILHITILEKNGQSAANLTRDEFSIYEDGVKQQIDYLDAKALPISLGIAIDSSGSMRDKLGAVVTSITRAVSQLRQPDEAFVAHFKAVPELLQEFTGDQRLLVGAVDQIYTSGGTSLLDAIIALTDYTQVKGKHQRKALLFVTDGLEKNSTLKEQQVITALKESQVQTYFIFYPPKMVRRVCLPTHQLPGIKN